MCRGRDASTNLPSATSGSRVSGFSSAHACVAAAIPVLNRAIRIEEDVCLREELQEASLACGRPQIQKRPALAQHQVVGDPCPGT
jgi:hypothetical protein